MGFVEHRRDEPPDGDARDGNDERDEHARQIRERLGEGHHHQDAAHDEQHAEDLRGRAQQAMLGDLEVRGSTPADDKQESESYAEGRDGHEE
jgi:hypothetical protein